MADERQDGNTYIVKAETVHIGDTHNYYYAQAPSDTKSDPSASQPGNQQQDAELQRNADEMKQIISKELVPSVIPSCDKLMTENIPDVNPDLHETDFYKGVNPEEANQLTSSSQPGYFNHFRGQSISYHDLALMIGKSSGKFISLSGNAGCGKTTLSKKLVRQLYKNKKNLVLHLSFMYLSYGNKKLTLQELLLDKQFPNVRKSIRDGTFQWIIRNQEDCVFLFDGLDQATWSLENAEPVNESYDTPLSVQQLVANLCSKKFFGKSSLIFTSRPHSLLLLPSQLRPDTTIYVGDLPTDGMKALFFFYAGEKASELWEKFQTNSPQIVDFCHNPLLLQFVVYAGLYGNADNINTMTNIFDAVLQQLGDSQHAHGHDIDFLKQPLGKMAYKGMVHKSVTFTWNDLQEVGLEDVNVQDVVIKVARYSWLSHRKVFKGAHALFYFMHQMLQEIFAAFYICFFMPIGEFHSIVTAVVNGGHWSMVRRFMCGILLGNGDIASEQLLLQQCEEFKTHHGEEKRKRLIHEFASALGSADEHGLLELLVDLQECCEEAKDHLAPCCPVGLNFTRIPMSMAQCHALGDFLSRITRTDVELELQYCNLDYDKLQQIYNGLKNIKVKLEFLDLGFNKMFGENTHEIISEILAKVRRLDIRGCLFGAQTLRNLKEALNKLEYPPEVEGLSTRGQRITWFLRSRSKFPLLLQSRNQDSNAFDLD